MYAALDLHTFRGGIGPGVRSNPERTDLTTSITLAGIDGDRLTTSEIVAFLILMVVAGNETTTKLLGNALMHLSAHPEQMTEVFADHQDPTDLVAAWVEETLRFDTSSQMLARHVRSEEHTSELQSLMRISYAFLCLKKQNKT